MSASALMGCGVLSAVLLARLLLARRLPGRILVLLWAGGLLAVLAPGALCSPLSVYGLLLGAAEPASAAAALPAPFQTELWFLLRRAVTGLGLLGLLISCLLGQLRLRRARPVEAPAVRDWLAAHPLLRPLRICAGRVAAPVCGGILLPRIVLPEDTDLSDREELDCVLTHEYVHVCRFDPLLKLLFAAALCLRWYDPLVWAAVLTAGRDMEYACDEAVLDAGILPKRYAAALLRAALRRSERIPAAARFNAGQIERRVDRITSHRPRSPLSWLAACLLALGLLAGFGTVPKAAEPAAPEPASAVFMESARQAACRPDVWAWNPTFPAKTDPAPGSDR